MMFASLIKGMDTALDWFSLSGGAEVAADEMFYDPLKLTESERTQADAASAARSLPEGSLLLVEPGSRTPGFRVFACADPSLAGEARARQVVDLFERHAGASPRKVARTVVVPGCGSSPLGAAALGKAVAEAIGRPVAAIVAGQGALDIWCEALSGGMMAGPAAQIVNTVGKPLEFLAKLNPFARPWATACARELTNAIPEAATLCELLKRRLVDDSGRGISLRDASDWQLDMIVSHSKGNWAVQAALLDFELDVAERIEPPVAVDRHIDVVTFGTWVDLPDQNRLIGDLFRYHQYLGTHDPLALLTSSSWALARLVFAGQFEAVRGGSRTRSPCEMFLARCGRDRLHANDNHVPLERLLPAIRTIE